MTVIKIFLIKIYVLLLEMLLFVSAKYRRWSNQYENGIFFTQSYIYICSVACLRKVNKVDRESALHILGVKRLSYLKIFVTRPKSLPLYYVSLKLFHCECLMLRNFQRSFTYHEWVVKMITIDLQSNGCDRKILFFWCTRLRPWIYWSQPFGL
jgi:hypothetical protein